MYLKVGNINDIHSETQHEVLRKETKEKRNIDSSHRKQVSFSGYDL